MKIFRAEHGYFNSRTSGAICAKTWFPNQPIPGFGQRVRCVWRNKEPTVKGEDVVPDLHSHRHSTRQEENESVKGTFISSSTLSIVLISSQSYRRFVGKSVPSKRKPECLKCLALLSTILARECECLHLCLLRLVHILPKVSTKVLTKSKVGSLRQVQPSTMEFMDC